MNTIKEVKRFQTSDERIHESELAAALHQQQIDIRGIIQSDDRIGKNVNVTLTQVSAAVVTHIEEIAKVMTQYKRKINNLRKKTENNS